MVSVWLESANRSVSKKKLMLVKSEETKNLSFLSHYERRVFITCSYSSRHAKVKCFVLEMLEVFDFIELAKELPHLVFLSCSPS